MNNKQLKLSAKVYLDRLGFVCSSIYIENEHGFQYSIDSKYFCPLFGSVKEKHWINGKKWAIKQLELAEKHGSIKVVWPEKLKKLTSPTPSQSDPIPFSETHPTL